MNEILLGESLIYCRVFSDGDSIIVDLCQYVGPLFVVGRCPL